MSFLKDPDFMEKVIRKFIYENVMNDEIREKIEKEEPVSVEMSFETLYAIVHNSLDYLNEIIGKEVMSLEDKELPKTVTEKDNTTIH